MMPSRRGNTPNPPPKALRPTPYSDAGQNTRPTPWPDRDPMNVANCCFCAAQSLMPSPDRISTEWPDRIHALRRGRTGTQW
eukprot:5268281-Heterocapsa_arctica.AAC.1